MKKSLKTAGIILATAILFSLTGCKPEAHVHNFATEKTDAEVRPGYATNGSTTLVCDCGKEKVIEIEAAGYYEIPIDVFTGKAATKNSTYIYFGVFPNTIKASDVTINENESIIMGGNTYYKGSDGEWYAKVKENAYGAKYSDNTQAKQSSENSYRYFKVEPIKWKVLTTNYNNTGKALLLAEEILTANVPYYKYNSYENTRTVGSDTNIYPNNYKYSQIRAYLNGLDYYYDESSTSTVKKTDYTDNGFLQTAFTAIAQLKIAETEVDNSADSTTDAGNNLPKATTYACANTTDKIFLLSEKEVSTTAYGFGVYNGRGPGSARIRVTTDYAKANYAYPEPSAGYGGEWWLRSPLLSKGDCKVCFVIYDGRAFRGGNLRVDNTYNGVVPALCLSL